MGTDICFFHWSSTVKTVFLHFFPPNSPFRDYRQMAILYLLWEPSLCSLFLISVVYNVFFFLPLMSGPLYHRCPQYTVLAYNLLVEPSSNRLLDLSTFLSLKADGSDGESLTVAHLIKAILNIWAMSKWANSSKKVWILFTIFWNGSKPESLTRCLSSSFFLSSLFELVCDTAQQVKIFLILVKNSLTHTNLKSEKLTPRGIIQRFKILGVENLVGLFLSALAGIYRFDRCWIKWGTGIQGCGAARLLGGSGSGSGPAPAPATLVLLWYY